MGRFYEDTVARLSAALDSGKLASLRAQGAETPVERAIELALAA
jgi:hypothetical protein